MVRILAALLLSVLLIIGSIIITLPLLALIIYRDGKILWLRRKNNNYKYIVIFYVIIFTLLAISNIYIYSKTILGSCHYKNAELNTVIDNINASIRVSRLDLWCADDCGMKKADISWSENTSVYNVVSLISQAYNVDLTERLEPIGYSLGGFRATIFVFKNKKQNQLDQVAAAFGKCSIPAKKSAQL